LKTQIPWDLDLKHHDPQGHTFVHFRGFEITCVVFLVFSKLQNEQLPTPEKQQQQAGKPGQASELQSLEALQ
jgi:hypothetical protein